MAINGRGSPYFRDIDGICQHGYDEAGKCRKDPALGAVKHEEGCSPEVFSGSEGLDAVGIGDAVVHPVGRGELIVPHALVGPVGPLRLGHRLLSLCEGLYEPLAP